MDFVTAWKSMIHKFNSGNNIDVHRTTIDRDEFDAITEEIIHLRNMRPPENNNTLTQRITELEAREREALLLLGNVWYWETCPQEYRDRIAALTTNSKGES